MKTLTLTNNLGSSISFVTDLIDGSEQLSVLQIITNVNGVETIGIPDAITEHYDVGIELGKCYMLENFIARAQALGVNLLVADDLAGTTPVYLVDNRT